MWDTSGAGWLRCGVSQHPMLDDPTIQRFENALPGGPSALKELAMSMANQGLSQAAICHVFDSFGRYLHDAGRDDEAAFLWVAIECIVGWKSRSSWWFDHYLTKEELDEYRRQVDAPQRPLFYADTELYHRDG